ncbi:MAG: hypothetical protein AAF403_03705, partial [Pseudomonadota bacterium]
LFVLLVVLKARAPIKSLVWSRIERIKKEIEEANKIREDSEILLNKAHEDLKKATEDAEAIIENAEKEAQLLLKNMTLETDRLIEKRQKMASDRIAQMSKQFEQQLKSRLSDLALTGAKAAIEDQLKGEQGELIFQQIVKESAKTLATHKHS